MARVVLAMSGGVDSSVAAYLLKQAGHEVIGVFMRHGEASPAVCQAPAGSPALPILSAAPHKQGCCTASDALDARRVADRLAIPFYAIDFQQEFSRIIDYFIDEYTRARTPNPCVMCNTWLKFGALFNYAASAEAQFVATGHYARLVPEPDGSLGLYRGIDPGKDQAYVLFGIDRSLLPRMLLPLGDYHKPRIRQIAAELGLNVADKKDSQEICFVSGGDHAEFIRQRRGASASAGQVVATDGTLLGQHDGLERFTIGQRKGVGVALGDRAYVVRLDPERNEVVLGTREELARQELTAGESNWLIEPPLSPLRCLVKIRYNALPASGTVQALPAGRLQVRLDEPQYGVAPGQAVVCFDGDRVLGGGWIES